MAREAFGHKPVPWLQPMLAIAIESAQTALGAEFDRYTAEGRNLSVPEAIHMAFEVLQAGSEAGMARVG